MMNPASAVPVEGRFPAVVVPSNAQAEDLNRAAAVLDVARMGTGTVFLLRGQAAGRFHVDRRAAAQLGAPRPTSSDPIEHPAELLARATDIAKAEGADIWYFGPCRYPAVRGEGESFARANQDLTRKWQSVFELRPRVVCDEQPMGFEWQDACEEGYLRCLPTDLDALRATARALWPPWGEQILARLPGWPQRKIGEVRSDASPAPDPPPAAPVAQTESDPPDAAVAAAPPTPPPSSGAVIINVPDSLPPEPPADPGLPLWKIILACALLLGVAIGGWVLLRPRSRVPAMAAPTRRNGELLLLDLFSRSLVLERVRVPLGQASRSQIHPLPCEPQGRQAIVAIEVEPVAQRKDAITVNLIVDDLSDPEAPARSGQVVELTHGGEAVAFGLLRVRWAG